MKKAARKVVSDADGTTRIEEIEIEFHHLVDVVPGAAFDAAPLGTNDVALVSFEPGFVAPFHNTPAPTWMMILTGRMALGVSDGVQVVLAPGDAIYMTDADGEGHRSHVVGDEAVLMATAGFGG
jgi:quercetin dioxygenase-like cupin family protein